MNKKEDNKNNTPLRRKWNDEDYKQKVKDREAGLLVDEDDNQDKNKKKIRYDLPTDKPLDFFKARDKDLNLSSKIGKASFVQGVTPTDKQGGFYCETCDMHFKDSNSALDHENSRRHNRLKGVSMRVESSTLSQIQNKLKKAKEDKLAKQNPSSSNINIKNQNNEKQYEKIYKELEEKEKKEKEEKDKLNNNDNSNNNNNNNQEIKEINKKDEDQDQNQNQKEKEKEKEKVEYEDDEFDYSSLGLPSNFGTSKK